MRGKYFWCGNEIMIVTCEFGWFLMCFVWMYMLHTLLCTHVLWSSKKEWKNTLELGTVVPHSSMAVPIWKWDSQEKLKPGMTVLVPLLSTAVPPVRPTHIAHFLQISNELKPQFTNLHIFPLPTSFKTFLIFLDIGFLNFECFFKFSNFFKFSKSFPLPQAL